MTVVAERLRAQRLIGERFATVAEAVAWFGAVQAQDYLGARWAVGQRVEGGTATLVEAALAAREVIRTWPMRGTLHFVAADDARWITRLLAPRILRRAETRYRALGIDAATIARAGRCLEKALAGTALSRAEVYAALSRAKVSPEGQRGIHLIGALAMQGMICIGAPRRAQQTFVLLDEWIPRSRELAGDSAVAELARRYVTSHGPATTADFAWWTGLSLGEAKVALAAAGVVERDGMWRVGRAERPRAKSALILPAYDEYAVAYRDRSALVAAEDAARAKHGIFSPIVVVDGRVVGTWARAVTAKRVSVTVTTWHRQSTATMRALEREAARYGEHLGVAYSFSGAAT